MAVFDDFARGTLGANWESPAFVPLIGDEPLVMISGLDGVEVTPLSLNDEYCSGIYIGQEFTYNKQYAEIEYLDQIEFANFTNYQEDYGVLTPMLNAPKKETLVNHAVELQLWPYMYQPSSYYRFLYWQIITRTDAGARGPATSGGFPLDRIFIGDRMPVGTKNRLERIGDTYYALIYSPDVDRWIVLGTMKYDVIQDGYPGIRLYALNSVDDARATNFRAGSSGDDFMIQGPSYKPGNQDTSGNRNKRESRLFYPNANDVTYRLGDNDIAEVSTFDNKNRNRFS